jgi:oligoribonuclease NrnB/cAMP/cGMP phosphodiesterase (DHH superfamily)
MLQIEVPAGEFWDEKSNQFVNTKATTLTLEHSLVSLSKWESKWCKPFLTKEEKTTAEILDYIKCMTLTQNVDPNIYMALSNDNIEQIKNYINHPHTATTIKEDPSAPKTHEVITSELIYYWMIALNVPVEFQKWHLNRLLTLIKVCNVKNAPPKKMSQRQLMSRNAALNAARRQKLHSKG